MSLSLRQLLKDGYVITEFDIRSDVLMDYVNELPTGLANFWTPCCCDRVDLLQLEELLMKTPEEGLKSLSFLSLEEHRQRALRTASSFPLMLLEPSRLYPKSRRPITKMEIFRPPSHKEGGPLRLPVSRYATSMSGRLFDSGVRGEEDGGVKYEGTFFYLEEESEVQLSYRTSRSFRNKYDCLVSLDTHNKYVGLRKLMEDRLIFMAWHRGELPEDLMMTPQEAFKVRPIRGSHPWSHEVAASLPATKHYAGHYLSLYAAEDDLDQAICKLGQEHQIDVIVLTHMVGSFQVVTEVLDTRPREDSFRSLIYPS